MIYIVEKIWGSIFSTPRPNFAGFFLRPRPFYEFSTLQTLIKLFLNENLTFVWYVASNVSFCGLCNAREPIYYSCCLYFLHFLLIESGWGNLMGKFNRIIRSVRLHILAE